MEALLQTRRGGLTPNGCDLEVGSSHLYTSYTRYRCNRPEFGWGLERRGPIGTCSGGVRRALPGIRSSVSQEGSKLDTSGSYGRRSAHFSKLRSVHRPEATGFSSFRKGEQRGSSCPSASYGFNEFFVKRRILAFATQNGFAECSSSGHIPGTWPRGKREATQLRCSAYGHSQSNYEDPLIRQEGDAIAGESIPPRQPSSASWMLRLWKVDWLRLIFGISDAEKPWTVPWTGQTIFQVMFLWFAAFWLVGSWIIPIVAEATGFSKHNLSYRGQALYSLITDIAEGTVGLGILYRCLSRFHPLPGEWFPVSWRGRWYVEATLGCLLFPLVNRLSQLNLHLLPFPTPFISTHVEQSIMARDPIATLLYAVVVSVCAPIWEEVIFRGFLLPSLTKYLPVWGAIIVSSIAFALAHFSIQRMLPLTFLGLVMGIVFVRSRNLLASMLLHSLWNGCVFLDLLR